MARACEDCASLLVPLFQAEAVFKQAGRRAPSLLRIPPRLVGLRRGFIQRPLW